MWTKIVWYHGIMVSSPSLVWSVCYCRPMVTLYWQGYKNKSSFRSFTISFCTLMIHDFQIFPFSGKQLQNPKMFLSLSFDLVNVESPSGYHYWPDRIVDKSLQLDWNNYCFSILQWTSPVQARNKGNGHLSKQQVVFVTVFEPPWYGRLFSLLT